ncbi:MAG: phosphodiester glycosidase family protein [Hyphomicrobiales bacterium]|nr:phosphodiester glycosidase family protein [Hyphomicrobiales bacterium]
MNQLLAGAAGFLALVASWSPVDPVHAEDLPEPDLAVILEAGRSARAERLSAGLEHRLVAVPPFGLTVHTFVFDDRRFRPRLVVQSAPTGDRIEDFLRNDDDVFAIDGGFFEKDRRGRLSPSGLLVVDGAIVAHIHPRAGSGVLHTGPDGTEISYRDDAPPPHALESAVQVGPILVDPGGRVGIHPIQGDRRRRSAICTRPGKIVAIVVDGDGLNLFQLASLLAIPEKDGGVGCDVAINLDGGPSTQAVFRANGRSLSIPGDSTVHNAVVISPR